MARGSGRPKVVVGRVAPVELVVVTVAHVRVEPFDGRRQHRAVDPDELAERFERVGVAHDGGGSPGLLVNIRYLLMKQLSKINQYGRFGNS